MTTLSPSSRLATLLFYLLPMAFSLAVYGYGLLVSYHHDDWVWLGQYRNVHSPADLFRAIFGPSQHGTFRPFSERLPFLIFGPLFGDDALPFRILVFVTHFANLALFSRLVLTLTGSRLAGFAAPFLWTVNANLAVVMTWSCAYMQVLCGFLLLCALTLFVRYTATGRRRYYYWQWLPFLIGFGAMETTVVYPALALGYALLFARPYWKSALPLFGASAAFLAFHFWHAPKQAEGPYSIHFDLSIFQTFATYWSWSLSPLNLGQIKPRLALLAAAGPWLFTAAIAVLVVLACLRRNWTPLFFFFAYGLLVAPVLPLRDHVTDYYLTLPAMAMAGILASGIAAFPRSRLWTAAGLACCVLFLGGHWPVARFASKWWYECSRRIDLVVRSAAEIRARHPSQMILFADVNDEIYNGAFKDDAFAATGVSRLYLDPASRFLTPALAQDIHTRFLLSPAAIRQSIQTGSLVVYSASAVPLHNVTSSWTGEFLSGNRSRWPQAIRLGDSDDSGALGPTWYPPEPGYRWMPAAATVQLAPPRLPGSRLFVAGHISAERAKVPGRLSVKVAGTVLGGVDLSKPDAPFQLDLALPETDRASDTLMVTLEVDKLLITPTDPRPLGVVLTEIAVKPPAATRK